MPQFTLLCCVYNSVMSTTKDKSWGTRKDDIHIELDLNVCIAAGPCAVAAAKTFRIRDEDGKAIVVDPDGDDYDLILEAAMSCPVRAITLKDKDGNILYPKD